jgi:hypothetical protein
MGPGDIEFMTMTMTISMIVIQMTRIILDEVLNNGYIGRGNG